ncbi:hypothetical protein ALI144C_10320 [Actinosynnema sp. ALI-1.44]|nr:hypothetical protein ALI144C_10320 [Actinosynnema sp. ALI-1.44]
MRMRSNHRTAPMTIAPAPVAASQPARWSNGPWPSEATVTASATTIAVPSWAAVLSRLAARAWDWLDGFPALDLVNTVKRIGWQEREQLKDVADLDSWLDAAALPVPRPAHVDVKDLHALRALRDPALRLLHARLGRGDWLHADVEAVNTHLLAAPELVLLGEHPGQTVRYPLGDASAMTRLLAGLAADVRDATQRSDLAFCDAPGCGLVFYRRRTNQSWCGASCGNRVRVARHQAT